MSELRRRLELLLERLSPRERLLLGAAGAVSVGLLLWLTATTLAERRQTLLAQIAASERELAETTALRDRYLHLRTESDVVRRRLASGGADFSLFSHLESTARDVLSRERVAAMNTSSHNVGDDLQQEEVEMRLSGVSLRDLVALLYRVEKSDLPILVGRLQMKKRFDEPYLFDATVVVARLRLLAGAPAR